MRAILLLFLLGLTVLTAGCKPNMLDVPEPGEVKI